MDVKKKSVVCKFIFQLCDVLCILNFSGVCFFATKLFEFWVDISDSFDNFVSYFEEFFSKISKFDAEEKIYTLPTPFGIYMSLNTKVIFDNIKPLTTVSCELRLATLNLSIRNFPFYQGLTSIILPFDLSEKNWKSLTWLTVYIN